MVRMMGMVVGVLWVSGRRVEHRKTEGEQEEQARGNGRNHRS